jgi:hypothetical protein
MPVHAGAPVKETFRVEAASQDQNEPRGKKPGLLAAASGFLALSAAQGMKNSRRAERSKRHRQPVFKEACCKHVFTRRDMALRLLELYRCWCGSAWGDEASNLLGRCECCIHLRPIFRLYGTHKLAKWFI